MSCSDIGDKHDVDDRLIMLVTFSVQDAKYENRSNETKLVTNINYLHLYLNSYESEWCYFVSASNWVKIK